MALWDGLISTDPYRLDYSSTYPNPLAVREEVAYLNAYASPSEAILLSAVPPIQPSVPGRPRLLSVDLTDWASFYAWRGLPLTSPVAFLLHWPLTIYFILNNLLRHIGEDAYLSVIYQESLTIHLIGVEREVDLLPVFKELDHLISPDIKRVQLIFIGPTISPVAHSTLWYLSARMSAGLWRGLYHDFIADDLRRRWTETADVIIGFNAGLATYGTWPETVDVLNSKRPWEIQDASMVCKYEEIQRYADRNGMKNVKAIKAICAPCIKGTAPLLGSDGTTLRPEKSQILKRWAEHFGCVLNRSSAISEATMDRFPQVDTNNDLDLSPSLPETIRPVEHIFCGKAPGSDAIPAEVYKHGGLRLMKLGKPLFFTDSCQYSCLCSLRVLEKLKLRSTTGEVGPKLTDFDFLSSLVLNPFRCPLRIPSMSTKWPWLSNAFIFSPCVDFSLTKQMLDIKL
ncbi:unnamed protein product [Schistocephalus solidus]|uniref:Mitochondrial splicing suppressor 51-like C-terminal domain-containing protein n=1 Tax=Schistocephalus solidus TaxID=70667 RepID=A0A3P7CVI7_SCHSO|nr:unnamed protein product [Schistocephalus solidus]